MNKISRHKTAKITLIAFYLMQAIFASIPSYKDLTFRLCGLSGILLATTLILIPALVAYEKKKYSASTAAAVALLPFVIYANIPEFVLPYRGGGASMSYVIVFLFGLPISIVIAISYSMTEKSNEK
ncbi:MAG: hypothetical protein HZB31_13300 [Nitrospirae bacterium]|nr:hypothetical protein [Nitrospirota bacterium]